MDLSTNCCTTFILSGSQWVCNISKCEIENNTPCVYAIDFRRTTPCVYAIDFRRTTMLAYIYHGHSIAYDPIYDRLQQQQATKQQIKNVVCKNNIYIYRLLYCWNNYIIRIKTSAVLVILQSSYETNIGIIFYHGELRN